MSYAGFCEGMDIWTPFTDIIYLAGRGRAPGINQVLGHMFWDVD